MKKRIDANIEWCEEHPILINEVSLMDLVCDYGSNTDKPYEQINTDMILSMIRESIYNSLVRLTIISNIDVDIKLLSKIGEYWEKRGCEILMEKDNGK